MKSTRSLLTIVGGCSQPKPPSSKSEDRPRRYPTHFPANPLNPKHPTSTQSNSFTTAIRSQRLEASAAPSEDHAPPPRHVAFASHAHADSSSTKRAQIRARKVGVIDRVFALLEALQNPERALASFLKRIHKGLRSGRLVITA